MGLQLWSCGCIWRGQPRVVLSSSAPRRLHPLQEELQQLLGEVLQSGAAAHRRPGAAAARVGAGGGGDGKGPGGGGGGGGGRVGGVRGLLSDLNPVHFLEQLSALAERTADFAENALGGNLSMPPGGWVGRGCWPGGWVRCGTGG